MAFAQNDHVFEELATDRAIHRFATPWQSHSKARSNRTPLARSARLSVWSGTGVTFCGGKRQVGLAAAVSEFLMEGDRTGQRISAPVAV